MEPRGRQLGGSSGWRRAATCSTDHLSENCLEVQSMDFGAKVALRSSVTGATVIVTPEEFAAFAAGIRAGEFNDLMP